MAETFLFSIKEHNSDYIFYKKKSYKLIIIKHGSILYRFNNKEKILRKYTAIFANNRTDIFIKQSNDSELIYILFTKDFLDQITTIHNRTVFNFFFVQEKNSDSEIKTISLSEGNINFVISLVNSIRNEDKRKEPVYFSAIQAKFTELLIYFYRIYNRDGTVKQANLTIDEIEFYIKNNYSESFTLNGLADKCGFNPSYFSRAFKSKTGMAVFEYINRIRIDKACMLLKRTDLSIIEIAYSTGYNNISFFNRYFRKIMNTSPHQYKNMLNY